MDILMIGLTPPIEGGSQRHIYEVSSRLKCEVLTQRGSICQNKIELPVLGKSSLLLNISFFLACLIYSVKLLLIKRHKIIHIHENLLYPLAIVLKLRYKVVITVHGISGFKFYESRILWFFFKQGLKIADLVVSVSENDRMLLSGDAKRLAYIPNGVDSSLYNKINSSIENKITFLGRIHEQKGISYLLEAFELLRKENKNIGLEIIGKENDLALKLKNKFPDKKIKFSGFILDRKAIFKELASSYILVYPSVWEALPWPALLEGLASGRPVIASDLPGMRQVFKDKHNIILFKPENSKDLAEKLKLLIKNKNLANKIGKNGRLLAKDYDWGIISKKIEKEYEKL